MVQPRGDRGREDGPGSDPDTEKGGGLGDRGVPSEQGDPVAGPDRSLLRDALEAACRRREAACTESDPVRFPRRYRDPGDIETAAFLAATFAFGRVSQIHRFLERLFAELSPSPHAALCGPRPVPFRRVAGLSHRFISPKGVHRFLLCVRDALLAHGSLEGLYRGGMGKTSDVREGLSGFLGWLRNAWGEDLPRERNFLFPDPRGGSACKRHNLFLRWMVRGGDGVDLGIWTVLAPGDLVVPLDTHMARLGRWMGLTLRRGADWKAAEEITASFRSVCPDDPLRFDFPLTRIGILGECTARRRGRCGGCPIAPACAAREAMYPHREGELAVAVHSPLG